MQPGRQQQPRRNSSPPGMGNTNTIHVSPPITRHASTQNPTVSAHSVPVTHQSTAHNVQKNTCTLFADRDSKCASSSDDASMQDDVVPDETEHQSSRHGTESANAAVQKLSAKRGNAASQAEPASKDKNNDEDDIKHVSARIPTPPHPINTTRFQFPPFPAAAVVDADGSPPEYDTATSKMIVFYVDIRSQGRRFALPISSSNNESMLVKLLHKDCKDRKKFSPRTIFPGLIKHQIKVTALSHARMDEMRTKAQQQQEQQQLQAAAIEDDEKSSASFVPQVASDVVVPSHRFLLKFDTTSNRDAALSFLRSLHINAYVPSTPTVRGKVYGIPYHITDNIIISQHLQQHAWYVGGAPSLTVTRINYDTIPDHTMSRNECFFSVTRAELPKAMLIPSLASPQFPLRFEIWKSSPKKICNRCWGIGHNRKTCPDINKHNKQSVHGSACGMCASFDHMTHSCTTAMNKDAKCILCKQGKHAARNCDLYLGTYTEVNGVGTKTTNPPSSVWKGIPHALTKPAASVAPSSSSSSVISRIPAPPQQQQHQHHSHHDKQYKQEIQQLKSTISRLETLLSQQTSKYESIIQQMVTQQQQLMTQQQTFMQMITLALNMKMNNTTNTGIDVQPCDVTSPSAARVPASPVMTTTSMPPPSPKPRTPRVQKTISLANQTLISEAFTGNVEQTLTTTNIEPLQAFLALTSTPSSTRGKRAAETASPACTPSPSRKAPASARTLSKTISNTPSSPPFTTVGNKKKTKTQHNKQ